MSEVVNESDRTTEPDKRVVYVRVNGYADHGANMNRYTTYEVEFRLRDECRVLCQKRYSHFRDLYKTASIVNEEVKDFEFPAKIKKVDDASKAYRMRKFDDLLKLMLALAPKLLNDWIETAHENQRELDESVRLGDRDDDASVMSEADSTYTSQSQLHTSRRASAPLSSSSGLRGASTGRVNNGNGVGGSGVSTGGGGNVASSPRGAAAAAEGERRASALEAAEKAALKLRATTLENSARRSAQELAEARIVLEQQASLLARLRGANSIYAAVEDSEVELEPNLTNRYAAYKVVCRSIDDPSLVSVVRRRYNDFVQLHATLDTTLDLPRKVYFNLRKSFLAHRQQALHTWLQQVMKKYCVLRHGPLRTFLGLDVMLAGVLPENLQGGLGAPGDLFSTPHYLDVSSDDYQRHSLMSSPSMAGVSLAENKNPDGDHNDNDNDEDESDPVADAAEAALAAATGEWPSKPPTPSRDGSLLRSRASLQQQQQQRGHSIAERSPNDRGPHATTRKSLGERRSGHIRNTTAYGNTNARSVSEAPWTSRLSPGGGSQPLDAQPPRVVSEPSGDFWEKASQQNATKTAAFMPSPEAAGRNRGVGF